MIGYRGNLFRSNAKDNKFNKKYGTMRERNDSKIMLILDSNNGGDISNKNKEENKRRRRKKKRN